MGREMGGGLKREGDIFIPMADSCGGLDRKQQNSVKQLSFHLKKKCSGKVTRANLLF